MMSLPIGDGCVFLLGDFVGSTPSSLLFNLYRLWAASKKQHRSEEVAGYKYKNSYWMQNGIVKIKDIW